MTKHKITNNNCNVAIESIAFTQNNYNSQNNELLSNFDKLIDEIKQEKEYIYFKNELDGIRDLISKNNIEKAKKGYENLLSKGGSLGSILGAIASGIQLFTTNM